VKDNPDLPDQQATDWETSVEAELVALRREVERLNRELVKIGSHTALLMREREDRQRQAKTGRRR
jgi:hypothetical protein